MFRTALDKIINTRTGEFLAGMLDEKPKPRRLVLSDTVARRPHAGRNSRRTHARQWVAA